MFNVLNPRDTVKAVAESIMREVVGLKTIDGILTSDRKSIEPDVQNRMQKVLDDYKVGVLVRQVQLQSVDAPAQVISAYRDVTAAQQDLQRAVNDADTYANRVVPEAEGQASRILAEAKAYREQTILEAKGQTSRYTQIYDQYKKAPGVTRERMYLETMERVLGGMPKTILDAGGGASAPVPLYRDRSADRANRRERRSEPRPARPRRDRRCRRRSSSRRFRCSRSIRPSRRWCCGSASRCAT